MWLYRLNTETLGGVLGLYWRLKLEGEIDAIPMTGPLLVAPNHASFLDPWFIAMAFPRPIRYLINRSWYERSPMWNRVFRAYGTLPVEDGSPEKTLDAVCEALSHGDAVGVFPEGKISRDGKLQRLRSGLARIAAKSGAPVVPVGLRGNYDSLPRTRRFPRPVPVSVHVAAPIRFPDSPRSAPVLMSEIRRFNDDLLATIAKLADRGQVLTSDS